MKAIVLHAYGPPTNLRYEDAPDPTPKSGEVVVRVHATSLNPLDWLYRSGAIQKFMPLAFPYILGVDLAGTVEGTGERVLALARFTYAERCVARSEDLVRIPDGVSFEAASTLPLVTITGEQLMTRGAKPAAGDTVLVTGALGGVGRAAIFAAALAGAKVIAGVRADRIDEARRIPGVVDAVALDGNLDALPTLDAVADAARGAGAAQILKKLRPGGRYGCFLAGRALIGDAPGVEVNALNATPDVATIKRYAEAMAAGKFALPIRQVFPLAEAAAAHALAERGGGGKVVLAMG